MCQYNPTSKFARSCIRIPRAPPQTSANNEALGETMSSTEPSYPKGLFGRLSSGLFKTGSKDPLIASYFQCSCRDTMKGQAADGLSGERHDTPKLLCENIAVQGSPYNRDRQPCFAQALRSIVMTMVEQMIRRPGDTKPAVADNPYWLFRCDSGPEIRPQF